MLDTDRKNYMNRQEKQLSEHIGDAFKYGVGSNIISGALVSTVVADRIPESLSSNEQKLLLIFVMATVTWVSNIALVIYKKKINPRIIQWLDEG